LDLPISRGASVAKEAGAHGGVLIQVPVARCSPRRILVVGAYQRDELSAPSCVVGDRAGVLGFAQGGWFLLAVWFGCNFLIVGVAQGLGSHRVFGKRAGGTLPLWSWLGFLPLLSYTTVVWHLIRLCSREV
jgi:hypothetical protein